MRYMQVVFLGLFTFEQGGVAKLVAESYERSDLQSSVTYELPVDGRLGEGVLEIGFGHTTVPLILV